MAVYTVKADTLANGASLGKTSPRKFARDSSGNLFAIYHRNDGTRNQIYISKSGDGGENWDEYKVTDDTEVHESPSIAIDSNDYIYVVCIAIAGYNTYDIWQIVKSTTGGVSWGSPADINAEERKHQYPVIAIDSNDYIHIACNKAYATNLGIVYTKSVDGGSNWDANTDIAEIVTYDQEEVAIAIDSNNYIHLVFIGDYAGATGNTDLRYRKYTDSWQAIENLTNLGRIQSHPSIAIDNSDYIHITHQEIIGVYNRIKYIKYTDSWQAIETLTTADYHHFYPSVSVDDDNVIYVIFYGYHTGSTTYRQIGYNYYTDSWQGVSWLTSGSIHNRFPNAIFARWPIDGSAKVNIPDTGFAFIWAEDDDIKIYLSADLTWQEPPPPVTHEIAGVINGVASVNGNIGIATLPQYAHILHRWKLDEESGTRYDFIGDCDLADNNTVLYGIGKLGNGADFELDNSEYLSATAEASADMNFTTGNFTISFWVKPEVINTTYQYYFTRGSWQTNGWYIAWDYVNEYLSFVLNQSGDAQTVNSVTNPMTSGNWYHIVCVRDGATGYMYINKGTPTSASVSNPASATVPFYVGAFSTPAYYYDGIIDEIIVWNVALSSAEVTTLYNWYNKLHGIINGVSQVEGLAKIDKYIKTIINGISAISGNLKGDFLLSGIIDAVSQITGKLVGVIFIDGQIQALSEINGQIVINKYLSGIISGLSQISGDLTGIFHLAGIVEGKSNITALPHIIKTIKGIISGLSGLSGRLIDEEDWFRSDREDSQFGKDSREESTFGKDSRDDSSWTKEER